MEHNMGYSQGRPLLWNEIFHRTKPYKSPQLDDLDVTSDKSIHNSEPGPMIVALQKNPIHLRDPA